MAASVLNRMSARPCDKALMSWGLQALEVFSVGPPSCSLAGALCLQPEGVEPHSRSMGSSHSGVSRENTGSAFPSFAELSPEASAPQVGCEVYMEGQMPAINSDPF